jgi:hypothetical protein
MNTNALNEIVSRPLRSSSQGTHWEGVFESNRLLNDSTQNLHASVTSVGSARDRGGYAFQIAMSPTLMSFFVTSTGPNFWGRYPGFSIRSV